MIKFLYDSTRQRLTSFLRPLVSRPRFESSSLSSATLSVFTFISMFDMGERGMDGGSAGRKDVKSGVRGNDFAGVL